MMVFSTNDFLIKCFFPIVVVMSFALPERCSGVSKIPPYPQNPYIIKLEIPSPEGSAGGIIVADVDMDGKSEYEGLPGHNAPGVQAGDIDRDGVVEVLFLTQDGYLNV